MDCYGNFDKGSRQCRECEWGASCEYYSSDRIPNPDPHIGVSSIDTGLGNMLLLADNSHRPDREADPQGCSEQGLFAAELGEFLRYMCSLDVYTLSILAVIIGSPEDSRTIQNMAYVHNTTRAALSAKILRATRKYPELASLFVKFSNKLAAGKVFWRQKEKNNVETDRTEAGSRRSRPV